METYWMKKWPVYKMLGTRSLNEKKKVGTTTLFFNESR